MYVLHYTHKGYVHWYSFIQFLIYVINISNFGCAYQQKREKKFPKIDKKMHVKLKPSLQKLTTYNTYFHYLGLEISAY